MNKNILIVGASENKERYSYKVFKMLNNLGYNVFLVNPRLGILEGCHVYSKISEIKDKIDTVTMYVSESISSGMTQEIIKLKPRRIIFNPGSENDGLEKELAKNNIFVEQACTLVLLTTNQF